jgi:hypothetical protein
MTGKNKGDLISRSAFIEQIEKSDDYYKGMSRFDYSQGFTKARLLAAKFPASDPWISVKDRLPPIDCEVFVHCSKGITVWNGSEVIDGVQYMEVTGEFMTDAHGRYGRIIKDVVSWQPLPSPPIEK